MWAGVAVVLAASLVLVLCNSTTSYACCQFVAAAVCIPHHQFINQSIPGGSVMACLLRPPGALGNVGAANSSSGASGGSGGGTAAAGSSNSALPGGGAGGAGGGVNSSSSTNNTTSGGSSNNVSPDAAEALETWLGPNYRGVTWCVTWCVLVFENGMCCGVVLPPFFPPPPTCCARQ